MALKILRVSGVNHSILRRQFSILPQAPRVTQHLHLKDFTGDEKQAFEKDGFVTRDRVISPETAVQLREHFSDLFAGKFPTGVYPDEWHWREGISKPDAFREIVNGWKCSPVVARVAMNPDIARIVADMMNWTEGVRIAQDDLLWKPPGAGGVGYHQDSAYISKNFEPSANTSVTVWIALDDADEETGVVEYAAGSHHWPAFDASAVDSSFHGTEDRLASVRSAAASAGKELKVCRLSVPCGGAVFHHQDVWHGSGSNSTLNRPRRALGLHLMRRDVSFRTSPAPDYIYGRYVLGDGKREVLEQFFPVTWSLDGYVSPIVNRMLAA